jgi:2-polyprenyl-3-methyl-5-hydroxy-6-metoxy-1,4-benzoquinol methylase
VLEVGAGHGGFAKPALAMGCEVTAVDMSGPSIEELKRRFGTNPKLKAFAMTLKARCAMLMKITHF